MVWLAIPIVIMTLAISYASISFAGNQNAQTLSVDRQGYDFETVSSAEKQSGSICTSETSASLTFKERNSYTKNSITGANIGYRKTGEAWSTTQSGQAVSFSPGTNLELAFNYENTTNNGILTSYTVPCETAPSVSADVAPVATIASITTNVWNRNGNPNANGTADEDITSGSPITLSAKITGHYQNDYGSPGKKNTVVCYTNSTAIANFELQDKSGIAYPSAPLPKEAYVGTNSTYAFAFPAIKSSAEFEFNEWIDPDDTNVPTGGVTYALADIVCEMWDSGVYLDSTKTGNMYYGVEDENRADNIGSAAQLVWTTHII